MRSPGVSIDIENKILYFRQKAHRIEKLLLKYLATLKAEGDG